MKKSFVSICFVIIFVITLLVSIFFIPIILEYDDIPSVSFGSSIANENGFIWPTPDCTTITSYFGRRTAPTAGSSSYHSGIDIGASPGTKILSILSGTVIYTGFSGAGGYTITINSDEFTASYCHISPIFIVSVGEYVKQGQVVAEVGPKNVYGVPNNPYKDNNGNPTNGATTGPHLHLTLKKEGDNVNPLDYLSI